MRIVTVWCSDKVKTSNKNEVVRFIFTDCSGSYIGGILPMSSFNVNAALDILKVIYLNICQMFLKYFENKLIDTSDVYI